MAAAGATQRKTGLQLSWLQSEVIREARRNNIELTPQAIEAILRPITQKIPMRQPAKTISKKHKPIIKPASADLLTTFMTAHLVPILKMGSAGNGPNGQLLPSYISPLITAFRLVLGEQIIAESSSCILQLENRYRLEHQGRNKIAYLQALAADPHSKALFAEFTIRFLLSFERYSHRKRWFIRVINSENTNKAYGEPNPARPPDFTVVHFAHFMASLALETKNAPKPHQGLGRMILRRFSAEYLERFQTIFKAIQRDYAQVTLYSFQ